MPDIKYFLCSVNLNESIRYGKAFLLLIENEKRINKKYETIQREEDMMRKTLQRIAMCMSIGFLMLGFNGVSHSEVTAGSRLVEHGRYMSQIAGCNDCHTSGYLLSEGKVPEKAWLTGSAFGWRGPWGTTYAVNLRLLLDTLTGNQWVSFAKAFRAKPPMPWFDVNIMNEDDLIALYEFVRYLGPDGKPAPAYVPPDKDPQTPYALFPSPPK